VNCFGVRSSLESVLLDLSIFEGGREICLMKTGSGSEVSMKQYSRLSDGFPIVVKSFDGFDCENVDDILYRLFLLTQLRHRCIAPLIGIVLPTHSMRLQTATLYYCCGSLQDVMDKNPVWWTPTTKCQAIAGIALAMQSAHEHGVAHGSLKPNKILFDEDHCVHIIDFDSNHFQSQGKEQNEMNEMKDICEDHEAERVKNTKDSDVFSFASIMFDILVDRSPVSHLSRFDEDENERRKNGEFRMIPEFVPEFVRELIEGGWSDDRFLRHSFGSIVDKMKHNNFLFMEGVDVWEIFEFVNAVEGSSF
jgi:serine/threonine protein kinase